MKIILSLLIDCLVELKAIEERLELHQKRLEALQAVNAYEEKHSDIANITERIVDLQRQIKYLA